MVRWSLILSGTTREVEHVTDTGPGDRADPETGTISPLEIIKLALEGQAHGADGFQNDANGFVGSAGVALPEVTRETPGAPRRMAGPGKRLART